MRLAFVDDETLETYGSRSVHSRYKVIKSRASNESDWEEIFKWYWTRIRSPETRYRLVKKRTFGPDHFDLRVVVSFHGITDSRVLTITARPETPRKRSDEKWSYRKTSPTSRWNVMRYSYTIRVYQYGISRIALPCAVINITHTIIATSQSC